MELEIWNGDWGLPSVDLICLQVMAYSKFSGAPLKWRKTNWPWSRYGHLPVFRHGSKVTLTLFDDIVSHLQKQNYNADDGLSPRQCSDIIAYTALLRDKLYPALLYLWWVDEKNYTELTRPWYAKVLRFPLNYFLPGRQQRAARKTISALWNSEDMLEVQVEASVFKDAQECLNLLSHRLGENEFFFGKNPCSLDAIVFGFLAPLLKAPFPNASLQSHLKSCLNLSQFVTRILQKYFPMSPQELEEQKRKDQLEKEEKQEFPHKWRTIALSATFAIIAMLGFALTSMQVQVLRDSSSNMSEEELELYGEEEEDDDGQ